MPESVAACVRLIQVKVFYWNVVETLRRWPPYDDAVLFVDRKEGTVSFAARRLHKGRIEAQKRIKEAVRSAGLDGKDRKLWKKDFEDWPPKLTEALWQDDGTSFDGIIETGGVEKGTSSVSCG